MITLAIDASTYRGSVAVVRDRAVLASREATMRGAHNEALMPAVAEALDAAGVSLRDVGRVLCGEGPGSFTSLRIAGAIAKGLCLGGGIPLYAMSSLGLALGTTDAAAGRYIVTIDALRDEWYAALFERRESGAIHQLAPVALVAKADLAMYVSEMEGTVVGAADGGAEPDASACVHLFEAIERHGAVDLDRWEPSYGRLAEAQVKWEAAHGRPLRADD